MSITVQLEEEIIYKLGLAIYTKWLYILVQGEQRILSKLVKCNKYAFIRTLFSKLLEY